MLQFFSTIVKYFYIQISHNGNLLHVLLTNGSFIPNRKNLLKVIIRMGEQPSQCHGSGVFYSDF